MPGRTDEEAVQVILLTAGWGGLFRGEEKLKIED
jgi:hypothetical protein